jgi:hypothetical protein
VRLPFMVSTVAQVIDGKTYPPGVWMNSANIADASITNAQIGSLTADKIVTGELFATIYVRTGKIFNGVDPSKPFPSGPSAGTGWGTGYFLGDHGGTNKFFVGSEPLNNWMSWNGSQFEVRGHIVGTSGSIGGTNMAFGTLFSTGVTNISNGTGFFLDSTGLFRVGNPVGSEIVWDGLGISIYDKNHALVMSSGQINWSAISGSPPAGIINTNISMNVNGTLNGAGGGQVTPAGIGAINTAGTNAPNSLLNSAITVTTNPSTGSIVFSGGPSSTGLNGIAMAGFRIDAANITNYLANAAIVTAVIGNAAVGNAQIANLAVTNAKIADLTVDTLKIGNNAVMIPSTNGYTFDEGVTATETVLFGGPVTGGAVVEFALTSMATLLNVLFVTELVQQNPTTGGSCTVVCYLNKRSDPNFVITRAFTVGIINNQPRFAQTASFSFINVPGLAVGDRYFMHISAKRNDSNGGQMIFGSKTITVSAHKK